MWFMFVLFVFEVLLLVVFLPIKIALKGYFCLERPSCAVDIKLYGLTIARFRTEVKDGKIVLKLGDKPLQAKHRQLGGKIAPKLVKYISSGNLWLRASILAVLGAIDAKTCAILSGTVMTLLAMLNVKTQIFSDFEAERVDAHFAIKSKICLFQVAEMLGE